MSEIGLFIKLSDSVEFLCIRAYQPPPYKYSITKGRITRGERNGGIVAHMPEKRERHDKLDLMTVAKKRDMKDIRLRYRQQPRPTSTLASFPSPSTPSSPMKPSSFVATHPGAFAPALTSSRK
ncbi:hypothetical protein ALC62_15830 [Cyphomyrmex costatus]|uniref:Uncharacterized protein n=1 Tax=Cyphomyrmex costatus TaxID=456900 RepID=A0A195BY01_9HYME|nr:hypothetical protein ALC62_15830 [Cyphomyrmex costatus]